MDLSPEEKAIRHRVRRFYDSVHWWGAWLLLYGTPTILAVYAYVRRESTAMMLAWVFILGVSGYQFFAGYRHNRVLESLLQCYEQALAGRTASDDAAKAN